MNSLKIYKSSAGSGKTFTLVKEYLQLVLANPDGFREVLAITFTKKAAEEMKSRIVNSLVELSAGKKNILREILEVELPGLNLTEQASKALRNILHDYSAFSICTIDSFFQRILRSLSRELQLPFRFELEIELEDAILEVTDMLLRDVGSDQELTKWISELVMQKLDDEKGWKIEGDISDVAKEIFKERTEELETLPRPKIREIYKELYLLKSGFIKKQHEIGEKALAIIQQNNLDVTDFYYGKSGVIGHFLRIRNSWDPEDFQLNKRGLEALENKEKWFKKNSQKQDQLRPIVENYLFDLLFQAHQLVEKDYTAFISACEVLKRIYVFGIVNDLKKKISEYRLEHNVILLADTTRLLSQFISETDAPFIYEKAGNRYKHLLIDEFQDTSFLQWNNLLPLVSNSLGSGNMSLVVGDAKQSIYRWRGGDVNLLVKKLSEDLKQFRPIFKESMLSVNFRSRKDIVQFNNAFFENIRKVIIQNNELDNHRLLELVYDTSLNQGISEKNNSEGYVHVEFISKGQDVDAEEDRKWKEIACEKALGVINSSIQKGYNYRDIALLVRSNVEGNLLANFLFENGIDKIISPDSLLITKAPKIRFLLNVLLYLSDPANIIARSEILYYYARYIKTEIALDNHNIFSDVCSTARKKKNKSPSLFDTTPFVDSNFNKLLPKEFIDHLLYLSKLPIYELCEQLIKIFDLIKIPDAYIQRFQDLVLEYSGSYNSSLDGFLDWWDKSKKVKDCSVIVPENENAIRIMTIHKAKGLQFPLLILPFCNWDLFPKPNQYVWVQSNVHPYKEMGRVAIPFSNNLEHSYFKSDYVREMENSVVDNVNLLYVAFTRAEEQLWIFCPEEKSKNTISQLANATLKESGMNLNGSVYSIGNPELQKKQSQEQSKTHSIKLASYPSNRWQEKISISSKSGDLLELMEDRTLKKINYGILIHNILSGISQETEIYKAIDHAVYQGLISESDKGKIAEEIRKIINLDTLREFFSPEWKVKNEQEIILPNGELLRPDRVVVKGTEAVVIDFKTGKAKSIHESQVKRYAETLVGMGYNPVRRFLVYIADQNIQEIPA